MLKNELENFFHTKIPITKVMGISVLSASEKQITLTAPLKFNYNDKQTAFGGSISTLMTLCGWAQVYALIHPHHPEAQVVIHKGEISFLRPITKDIIAQTEIKDTNQIHTFLETYKLHGKARLKLKILCLQDGESMATFDASYVAHK